MKKLLLLVALLAPTLSKAQSVEACDKIKVSYDDIRNTTTTTTEYFLEYNHQIWLSKIKSAGKEAEYYLSLREFSAIPKYTNGVYILFANGKRIAKPNAPVTVEVDSGDPGLLHLGYIQESVIKLTKEDLLVLRSSVIKKYALSFLDVPLPKGDALYAQFLCVLNKK